MANESFYPSNLSAIPAQGLSLKTAVSDQHKTDNSNTREEFRQYIENGKAKFNGLLITLSSDSIEDWGDNLLNELSPYVNGLQAGFYILNDESKHITLDLISVYGQIRANLRGSFRLGESLIGQAAKSKRFFRIANPRTLHTRSASSLVTIQPKDLLIVPLIYNQNVEGVLEITSAYGFEPQQIELLQLLSENIAANLANIIGQKKITRLYAEAQLKTTQLEEKEQKLRIYIEDLENTQNEMRKLQDNLEFTVQQRTVQLEGALKELQDAQNQIVQSEKLVSLGQLVAGVAHEINTPIGIAVTAASTLENFTTEFNEKYTTNKMRKVDLEDYVKYAVESSTLILKNLERAASLIQSFKRVAVNQVNDDLNEFNLSTYLHEVMTSLGPQLKKSGIRVGYSIDCDADIQIFSSMSAISQIVINFVMNSLVHAFDKKSEIDGLVKLQARVEGDNWILKYTDNGRGIPPDIIPKIFDPFFTTKRNLGGSGLGLNIVHNLVVQGLKGKIKCESIVGKGTTFTIVSPVKISN